MELFEDRFRRTCELSILEVKYVCELAISSLAAKLAL